MANREKSTPEFHEEPSGRSSSQSLSGWEAGIESKTTGPVPSVPNAPKRKPKNESIWNGSKTGMTNFQEQGMSIGEIEVVTLQGDTTTFGAIVQGKVALVVNVATRCGLTPQYEQLEELQRKYGEAGFTVVGFPCNQFFGESGDSEKIQGYCSTTWGISFPMMEKIKVKGRSAHPLYRHLTKTEDANGKAGNVAWNFEKFLVHPDGRVLRFRPKTVPDAPKIIEAIEDWVRN